MSSGQPNIVQVVESDTKLGANERVGGRGHLARHAVGLEAVDPGLDEVHVVPPSGNHGISVDCFAGDSLRCEGLLEVRPNLAEGVLFGGVLLSPNESI